MAKRQRPRASSRGKGGSRPGARPAAAPPRAGGLSASEEARAAEIEAQIVARDAAAENERGRSRDRRKTEEHLREEAPRTRTGSLLAIRGEQEYAYVVRDVRRILTVGGSLVGVLIVLYILIEVVGIVRI